jgi:hypothetical protein
MTAVPTSAATTTINTFKPKVRMLEVPLKGELSVKGGDSMKSRPRRSAVGAPARYFDLSAARPDLPQKVIRAPAGDKVSGKSATLFGYVFAATTCEAFGAHFRRLPGQAPERAGHRNLDTGGRSRGRGCS